MPQDMERLLASPYYNMDLSVPEDRSSAYDPTKTLVNPVQNQGIFGTCWAFAAVASAESSVYKQLQQEGIPYNVETNPVKYSPWYLAWVNAAPPIDVDKSRERLHFGMIKQKEYLEPFANKVYRDSGEICAIEFSMALGMQFKEMKPRDSDSMIAPREYEKASDVHLHNVFYLPNDDPRQPENIERIKEMLLNCGAAAMVLNADSMSQLGAVDMYASQQKPPNHAVTVIGWDDNYDFSRSGMRVTPENRGAWIVRNSWGADWGRQGDCYVSYEDESIFRVSSVDVGMDKSCFDHIATYEDTSRNLGGKGWDVCPVNMDKTAAFGAVYKSDSESFLKGVGFYTYMDDLHYTISVYKNCEDLTNNKLEPYYQQEGTFGEDGTPAWPGYRMVELEQPVVVGKGEKYAITVSLDDPRYTNVFWGLAADERGFVPEQIKSYVDEGDGKWQKVLSSKKKYRHEDFKNSSVVQRIYLKNIK